MSNRNPIRRGAFRRGLSVSLAGARAGGAFALDGAVRKLRGESAGNDERLTREANRFVDRLAELKGSYVKIGQVFAMLGEHFLPRPLTTALHRLESESIPLGWQHIEPQLRRSLGARFNDLLISHEALAAASLAQVHRARIKSDDREVVVKSQYPELTAVLDEDFDVVVRMMRLSRWIPLTRDFDSWLTTMREQLHAEVDYPREIAMARLLDDGLKADERLAALPIKIQIPAYFDRYCSDHVLTMEFIDGLRVTAPEVAALPQAVRNDLARAMLQLFFVEVFDLGLMQVDPNFGNYLISADGKTLSLLDFGSVMQLDESMRNAVKDTIVAGLVGDDPALMHGLVELGCLRSDSSDYARETFRTFIRHLLEPLRPPAELPTELLNAQGEYCWGHSALISRTGKQVAGSVTSRHFTIPTGDFALIARKLTGVFTFIAVLNAEFNAWDMVEPLITRHGGISE